MNACRPWHDPEPELAEVLLRLPTRTPYRRGAAMVAREVEALYTNGPVGGGGVTTSVRSTLAIVSTLISRDAVRPTVEVLA